jgi:hypothetical protein
LFLYIRCINQENSEEKNNQVRLMGRIYQSCQECLVYLGQNLDGTVRALAEPTSTLDFGASFKPTPTRVETKKSHKPGLYEVFEFFHKLSMSSHLHEAMGYGGIEEGLKSFLVQKYQSLLCEALRRFTHAPFTPWWSRIWVVQEITFPSRIAIHYGTISAPWSMFAEAVCQISFHRVTCCRELFDHLPRDEGLVINNSFKMILAIANLRQRYHTHYPDIKVPLLDLLRQFRDRKASEPRDKVYALLNMAQTPLDREPLVPDYSLDEVEVFRQATLESIYSTKSLSVFTTELGRKFRSDLPSWVPDWSAPGSDTYRLRAKAIELYDACSGETTPMSIIPTDDRKVCLRGMKIIQVDEVGEIMLGDNPSYIAKTLGQWRYLWVHHLQKAENKRPRTHVENLRSSGGLDMNQFWKSMCADVLDEHICMRRLQAEDMPALEVWARYSSMSPFSNLEDSNKASTWLDRAELWAMFLRAWPTEPNSDGSDDSLDSYFPPYFEKRGQLYGEILFLLQNVQMDDEPLKPLKSGDRQSPHAWVALYRSVRQELLHGYGSDTDLYLESDKRHVRSIDRSISTATLSRRLICSDGLIGLGPANMAVGDEIFLLPGGKTPFVLRPLGYSTIKWEGAERHDGTVRRLKYEIIGDCYLAGWMDGDAYAGARGWLDIVLV